MIGQNGHKNHSGLLRPSWLLLARRAQMRGIPSARSTAFRFSGASRGMGNSLKPRSSLQTRGREGARLSILRGHPFRLALADESGFTINELIVAMVVGSILVGYAFELYVFASRIVTSWRARTEIASAAEGVLNRMTLDLQRSSDFIQEGDSLFVMISDNREIASYRVSRGIVMRGDVPMHESEKTRVGIQLIRAGRTVDMRVRAVSGRNEVELHGSAQLQVSSTALVTKAEGGRGGAH
jgi:prepilin-type N-terminal cleavage/methylation domain-containing protein